MKWVFAVDDEPQYLEYLRQLIEQRADAKDFVLITESDASRARKTLALHEWDLVILDVELGGGVTGFDLAKSLRKRNADVLVWFFSNNEANEEVWREAGGNQFIAKSLTVAEMQTAFDSVQKVRVRPVVAVIEDDPFLGLSWYEVLRDDAEVHVFRDPGEFDAVVNSNPDWLHVLGFCITDYKFPEYTGNVTPEMVGQRLGKMGKKIYLCSNGDFSEEVLGLFSGKIEKVPHTLAQLEDLS